MKEILLTSSVLILALLALRQVFRNTISRRMQYALWGLVLLRLLLPFQLPAMEHSVLSATAPVQQTISANLETQAIYIPVDRAPISAHPEAPDMAPSLAMPPQAQSVWVLETDETAVQYRSLSGDDLLTMIWYAGMAAMAIWFLTSNLRFYGKICKARTPYSMEGCRYPVYLVEEELPSPCLFGLFHPAIYLTPAAAKDEETLRHVLAHETTHAHHFDPLWALLRGVCLVVYWFDPLVWAAAFASRTDCELACDEGALKLLGEENRVAYGRTLLSLIPLRKNPASPLLSATTMTSDKKRLKDRITRIAENRQSVHAAIFAVAALAVMVCAVTFTGAKTQENGIVPLTDEEIHWFNTEFFNGEYLDIQNQFLSSTYKSPEHINMFELFYCGTGKESSAPMSQEEYRLLLDTYYGGSEPDCACDKLPAADIDAVLLENIGMVLADTKAISMGSFDYLAAYDAYYHVHGDTNYRSEVVISSGEREGDLIRLYYYKTSMDIRWKCVTLMEHGDGYWFVSNLPCDAPEGGSPVQVILPPGEAERTIKLNNITEVGPAAVEISEADGAKVRSALGSNLPQITIGNTSVVCRKDGSNIYFSFGRTDGNIGESTFFDLLVCPSQGNPEESYFVERFYNLLGHNGFMISYYGDADLQPKASGNYIIHRYYALEDDKPMLLAATVGDWDQRADLDGDGVQELFYSSEHIRKAEDCYSFYFFKDRKIYGLDILALTFEAYPEWNDMSTGTHDDSCISITGSYQRDDGCYVQAFRNLYFTGEELLFYKDNRETTDHVMGTPEVPDEVLGMAKQAVEQYYISDAFGNSEYDPNYDPSYDDWRIENLVHDKTYNFPGGNLEVYNMNFEFHAANPKGVVLAGGMYHTEEDWVMPSYPGCFYLYVANENGVRRCLDVNMMNDCSPGTPLFDQNVYKMATQEGLLTSLADLDASGLLQMLYVNIPSFLEEMTRLEPEEQKAVASKICYYRTSGSQEDQARYIEIMDELVRWNTYELTTAQYDAWSLLFNYHVCQPAELTAEEQYAALDAASTYIRKKGEHEACLAFDFISASIDSYETWRVVNMYTDSAGAVSGGYDHDTMTHLTAVHVIYDISWDHTKVPADEEGRCGMYLYMLPDKNGNWVVWDLMTADVPELYEMVIDSLASDTQVILQMNGSGYMTEQSDYWKLRTESYATDLTWTVAEHPAVPSGHSLVLGNTEMGVFLRCWEESNLVQVVFLDEEVWYETTPLYADAAFDGRIFFMMRQWFDEVEWEALVGNIVIPDRGQSYQEVAQEWTDQYVQTALKVTPGSQYACSYVRAEASVWDWVPEGAYPSSTDGKERFYFGYTRVFVPASDKALQYQMAGNTVEYDASLGEAPEGAYMNSQVGPMYLSEDGWRCDGTGTGI